MVGEVGAGKTTRAKELADRTGAVRLSPDEWMAPLFGRAEADRARDIVEGRLIWTAVEILRAGSSVILDFGFWSREERAALSWLAGTVGAVARTEFVPVDRMTQSDRVLRRWQTTPEQTWHITQDELDHWRTMLAEPDAEELAGHYLTEPPAGIGWSAWIAARWPTALGVSTMPRSAPTTDQGLAADQAVAPPDAGGHSSRSRP